MASFLDALMAEVLLFRAAGALEKKKFSETKALLDRGQSHAPSHGGILLTLAYMQLCQGDYPGCKETLAEAEEVNRESPIIPLYEGMLHLFMNDPEKAGAFFKKSLERSPRNQLCQNYLSLCGIMTGAIREGLKEIKKTGIYSNARLSGFLSLAVERLLLEPEKSADKEPEVPRPERGIGTEQPCAEPPSTEPGETGGPLSANATEAEENHAVKSDVHNDEKEHEEPAAAFPKNDSSPSPGEKNAPPGRKKGLLDSIFNPFLGLPYWFLGQHYLNRGNFGRASQVLERVIDLAPETRRIHFHLGEAYFYENRLSPAFHHFNESLAIDGENGEVLYYLGKCLQEEEQFDEAEKNLEKSFALFPKSPETLYSLGQIAMRKGDERKAQQFFEETAEYDFAILGGRIRELEKRLEGEHVSPGGP